MTLCLIRPHLPELGETVIGNQSSHKFGGKGGNQAVSAAKTGTKVQFFGAVGDDEFGKFLLSTLNHNQVSTKFIDILSDIPSGMSVAITNEEGDYGAVVISNANTKINEIKLEDQKIWENVKILILQNEIPEIVNIKAALEAKKHGVMVCINAAPAKLLPDELQKNIDLLVVNAVEARDMSGISVYNLDTAAKAAKKLSKQYSKVVVTAGGDGVAFIEKNKSCIKLPAQPVKLISTHGAGDCFMGILCASLLQDNNLEKAVYNANKGAALHVSGQTV